MSPPDTPSCVIPFLSSSKGKWLRIHLARQTLELYRQGSLLHSYRVSTAAAGGGEQRDSGCTPRGWHIARAMIGKDRPVGSVFKGRRPTGEVYSEGLGNRFPDRDWILTRIIWLSGLEVGKNRLGSVDTMRRYIYIHGTPPKEPMGIPQSHGCIRMRNPEVIELFDSITPGTPIEIVD